MKFDFKIWVSKALSFVRKFVLRSQVYDDPPMKLQFAEVRPPKRVYDIRKKYFTFSIKSKDDIYKYLFYFFILFLLFLMPLASKDAGISDQEWQLVEQVKKINNGTLVPADIPYAHTHGLLLDKITFQISQLFYPDDPFVIRHIVSSLFGWGVILSVGLLLLRLFTWRAAFFGVLFLFITPRFTCMAYSDLPNTAFAFAYTFSIYQIFRLYRELPILKRHRLGLLILGIVLACSIHFGGAILLSYLMLLLPLFYFINNPIRKFFTKDYLKNLVFTFLIGVAITLFTYFICWFLYPGNAFWSASPKLALAQMTLNCDNVLQLFDGNMIWSNQAPLNYLPKYLFITTPLVVLISFLLFFLTIKTVFKKMRVMSTLTLLIVTFHPILFFSQNDLNVGAGLSQFMFILPMLTLIATVGYESLLQKVDDRYTNIVIVGVGLFLSLMPLRNLLLNHPFSAVYFNEISGGVHNAYGKYELDPNRQTNQLACNRFLKNLKDETVRDFDSTKVVVCTNGNPACAHFFSKDTAFIELRFCDFGERHSQDWDYYISFPYQLSSYQLKSGLWTTDETIYRSIRMEKLPVVVYFKNPKRRMKNGELETEN
ncbi:MAG: hypothetical protein MJZ76_04030 [Bacteroidales bacterium]|nr:hypothetical protein [Bacteroidales bacterium]